MHHAHQRGVIHRDLKPGNVLVSPDGRPKVVDFGIARLVDATADGVTVTGQVLGTIRYMSPEQAAGDPRLVDTRTDIYSLGAILYELLAERPLIEPDSGSTLGAAVQLLNTTPPRLSSVKREYRGDLDAIVHKAIERDPNDRYESASALADDLHSFLDGREVSARAPTTIEHFVRIARRNKPLSAAISVALVAILIGSAISIWQAIRATRAERLAVARLADVVDQTKRADAAKNATATYAQWLANRFLAAARPKDASGGVGIDVTVVDTLRAAADKFAEDFAGQPEAEALARTAIGDTWRLRGDFARAERDLRQALALRTTLFGDDDPRTLESRNVLAVLLYEMRRFPEAAELFERNLAAQRVKLGPDDPNTLGSANNLGALYLATGAPEKALPLFEDALARSTRTAGADDRQTLILMQRLADTHVVLEKFDRALPISHDVLRRMRATLSPDDPALLTAIGQLATLYQRCGRPADAIPLLEESLARERKLLPAGHPTICKDAGNLAKAYLDVGRVSEALPLIEEFISGERTLRGNRSEGFAVVLLTVSRGLFDAGQLQTVQTYIREANAILEEVAPENANHFAVISLQGRCLAAQRRFAEAEPLLLRAYDGLTGIEAAGTTSSGRRQVIRETASALVDLYAATARHESAEAFRAKLMATQPATQP